MRWSVYHESTCPPPLHMLARCHSSLSRSLARVMRPITSVPEVPQGLRPQGHASTYLAERIFGRCTGGKGKGSAGAPAFAPAPGLGGAAAAFLRPAGAPKEAKAMRLVSPITTEHLSIPAAAPAPVAAAGLRPGSMYSGKQVAQAAQAPGPGRAARKGQAAAAPAPTPVRGGTGFASLGNIFG